MTASVNVKRPGYKQSAPVPIDGDEVEFYRIWSRKLLEEGGDAISVGVNHEQAFKSGKG